MKNDNPIDDDKLRAELQALMPSDFPEWLKDHILRFGVIIFNDAYQKGLDERPPVAPLGDLNRENEILRQALASGCMIQNVVDELGPHTLVSVANFRAKDEQIRRLHEVIVWALRHLEDAIEASDDPVICRAMITEAQLRLETLTLPSPPVEE